MKGIILGGNFDDLKSMSGQSPLLRERMWLVAGHMYKQFLEYRESNINTAILFEQIAENISNVVDNLKQSFTGRGIPTENIYYEYDKAKHIIYLNILWQSITFFSDMKGNPKALSREKDAPLFTGRIIAVKGAVKDLNKGLNEEIRQKMLDSEVASLYVPADKNTKSILKIRKVSGELLLNYTDAPTEFVLKVIERVCAGGELHKEGSSVTINI